MAEKADNIKAYLKNDETFNRYLGEVWADLRGWVKTMLIATIHALSSALPKPVSGLAKRCSTMRRCANR